MKRDYIKEYKTTLMLKNYSKATIENYCCVINNFLNNFNISPERINEKQIIEYVLNYNNTNTKAQIIGALKIFFYNIIGQPYKFKNIPYPKKESKLPVILSQQEVAAIYNQIENLKHKSIFALLYSAGLRVSEVINLKITDIDSKRMIITIKQAKNKKDRIVPLSENVLILLRTYYLKYKPNEYLFNGQFSSKYSETSIRAFLNAYKDKANIKKEIYPHLLRHCCFTHLFEQGIDIAIIQDLAGHKSPKTTDIYRHLNTRFISSIKTPFDSLVVNSLTR